MRRAIFTVRTGNYEEINPAPKVKGWDSILITDQHVVDPRGWTVQLVVPTDTPALLSRAVKILSHRYLPDYDMVCYIDAIMVMRLPIRNEVMYFRHPYRTCVEQEAARVVEVRKADPKKVRKQIKAYKRSGFRDDQGLFQLGFFIRTHTPELNLLHEEWFKQVEKHTCRDQLSFPFALWKTGVKIQPQPFKLFKYHVITKCHRFTTSPQDEATKISVNQ